MLLNLSSLMTLMNLISAAAPAPAFRTADPHLGWNFLPHHKRWRNTDRRASQCPIQQSYHHSAPAAFSRGQQGTVCPLWERAYVCACVCKSGKSVCVCASQRACVCLNERMCLRVVGESAVYYSTHSSPYASFPLYRRGLGGGTLPWK